MFRIRTFFGADPDPGTGILADPDPDPDPDGSRWWFQWIGLEILTNLLFWSLKIRPPVQKLDNSKLFCQKILIFCQETRVFWSKFEIFGRNDDVTLIFDDCQKIWILDKKYPTFLASNFWTSGWIFKLQKSKTQPRLSPIYLG